MNTYRKLLCLAVTASWVFTVQAGREILPQPLQFNQTYELYEQAKSAAELNMAAPEKALVKFSRNGNMLYVNAVMSDLDCYNNSTKNHQVLHSKGDALRLYLQPENDTRLYEIQISCNNLLSVFFHWSTGRIFLRDSSQNAFPGVKAQAKKTSDGWECNIAVPLDQAAKALELPPENTRWKLMLIRYNYGKNHPRRDVSGYPQPTSIPDAERFAILPQK